MKYWVLLFLAGLVLGSTTIDRTTLGNGLAILSIEDHKIPMVDVCLVVKAGSGYDPEDRDGLAYLTARLLTYGTKSRTALQIAQEVEHLGSALNASCSEDYITLRTKVLARNLEEVFEVMADCVLNAQFAEGELARIKGEMLTQIQRENDDPFALVDRTYRSMLFGRHPYGHQPVGFDSTVNKITRSDAVRFHGQRFVPDNAFLAVVGDFEKKRLVDLIARYFAKWPKGGAAGDSLFLRDPGTPLPPIERPRGKVVKKDISQSYILLGHYGIVGNSPDWLALRMMNFSLGGSGLTSRMALNIREEKGLAYIVYSYFERKRYPGLFVCEVQTKNETGPVAIGELLAELRKMKEGGALARELDDARNYYTGNFPLRYDSYAEKVDLIIDIELHGLGLDYIDRFVDKVKAVQLGDINRMARDYLFPETFVLVVVGNITAGEIGRPEIEWEE